MPDVRRYGGQHEPSAADRLQLHGVGEAPVRLDRRCVVCGAEERTVLVNVGRDRGGVLVLCVDPGACLVRAGLRGADGRLRG